MTHYGSGADVLLKILNETPRVSCCSNSKITYDHPSKLEILREKCEETNGIYYSTPLCYIDRINENHRFCCKELYEHCYFLYFVRKPKLCIEKILSIYKNEDLALEYYAFRLRRICEMIRKTPKYGLIYYEDLIDNNKMKDCFLKVENLFNLKENSLFNSFIPVADDVNGMQYGKIIKYANDNDYLPSQKSILKGKKIYEKYSNFLNRFV